MFNLTLHDHLQLTFTEIVQRQHAHARKAQSRARWSRRLRGSEAVLIGGVSVAAAGAAFGRGQTLAIVAAVLAGVALLIQLVNLSFDFDASARAHAASAAHLWGLRERYRSLLSDLHDEALTLAEGRLRRDRLIEELRAVHDLTSVVALEVDGTQTVEGAEDEAPGRPPAYRSA